MLHKKSLGQHFLRSRSALTQIAESANLTQTDTVLEVGPGEGALTELLLERAEKVIAIEKDDRLIPFLQQKFSAEIVSGKFILIHADILNLDTKRYTLNAKRFKIVANLPYYITGQFLRKFLQSDSQPSSMTLLLQKEVAKRIVASDKRESILSISVKCYGTPRYIATVKAGAFSPRPKVDSAIIVIENISKDFFKVQPFGSERLGSERFNLSDNLSENNLSEKDFFALLKKGFAHPRKLLASNLGVAPNALASCGIATNARPENLLLEQWKCLAPTRLTHA